MRRCRECWHTERFNLPPVSRKIIYLDQFAISEMMKSINSKLGKVEKVDPFFRKLFEKLDLLNKMQVIVCPESTSHFNESFVSQYYPALKRIYEQLAHNFRFHDPDTIKRFQMLEDFNAWTGVKRRAIKLEHVLTGTGDLEGWDDRLIISVNLREHDPNLADELRKARDETSDALTQVFLGWQSDQSKVFSDWFKIESSSYGKSLAQSYMNGVLEFNDLIASKTPLTLNSLGNITSNISVIMSAILRKLSEQGLTDEESYKKSFEYLTSESLQKIPYVQISSMLFASLAKEAKSGRKKPPTKGMMNDVEVIASYAPYCDAMFVDNECRRLFNAGLKASQYKLKTKIFSQDNKEEFLAYLDKIEKSSSKNHLTKLKEVYGNRWLRPYVEMFDAEK